MPLIHHYRRTGFSLVEVLLAIAILVVLVGVIIPSSMVVIQTARETQTRVEIKSLDDACEAFKLKYGCYPPSRITLREKGGYPEEFEAQFLYDPNASGKGELITIPGLENPMSRVFRGIDLELYKTSGGKEWHDWNGNGQVDEGAIDLDGQGCLSFFLGGIPEYDSQTGSVSLTGFGGDRAYPTRKTKNGSRTTAFFEFDTSRLIICPPEGVSKETRPFPVYLDSFGTPYAYFSPVVVSDRWANGGLPAERGTPGARQVSHIKMYLGHTATDETLQRGIHGSWSPGWNSPYQYGGAPYTKPQGATQQVFIRQRDGSVVSLPLPNWYNYDRFQIISAGANRRFGAEGPAAVWPSLYPDTHPTTPGEVQFTDSPGGVPYIRDTRDNLCNFCEGRMERLLHR